MVDSNRRSVREPIKAEKGHCLITTKLIITAVVIENMKVTLILPATRAANPLAKVTQPRLLPAIMSGVSNWLTNAIDMVSEVTLMSMGVGIVWIIGETEGLMPGNMYERVDTDTIRTASGV